MTRQELELKAKEFDSKLKRHPMSSEELQKVLCDFVESLCQPTVMVQSEQLPCSHCGRPLKEHSKDSKLCPDRMKNFEQGN